MSASLTTLTFDWSTRNRLPNGRIGTFFYSPGMGFDTGRKVYYGRNEWTDESAAIAAQTEWEQRWYDHRY